MRDKIYAYVTKINWHYGEMNKNIKIINSINEIAFESINGKAILFDLFQIGELIERLPNSILQQLDKEDLKGIIDTRNYIVHGYGQLERDKIIDSVSNELPRLMVSLNNIAKASYEQTILNIIDKKVEVFVDQRIGANTPFNYGYVDNVVSPNGMFLNAYIIDIEMPIPRCLGTVVAAYKKKNDDCYCLLVVAIPLDYSESQIIDLINQKLRISDYELITSKNQRKKVKNN